MSTRNYHYYNKDEAVLKDFAEQYESMGRTVKVSGNRLTVFAKTPVAPPVKKKFDRKPKEDVESVERDKSQRSKRRD